jgi:hypothetical protein
MVMRYLASSRIWRRYSRAERDILHLLEDMRTDVGAEPFGRDELYTALQQVFQQERECDKMIKRFLARLEFHQQIDIARLTGRITHKRAK